MKYKEFKEKVKDWGQKHGHVTKVIIGDFYTYIDVGTHEGSRTIASISSRYPFIIDTSWMYSKEIEEHARAEFFKIVTEFAATKPEDREDEKRI